MTAMIQPVWILFAILCLLLQCSKEVYHNTIISPRKARFPHACRFCGGWMAEVQLITSFYSVVGGLSHAHKSVVVLETPRMGL